MIYESNSQLKLAWEFVQFTGNNIFLTGKAGTGKTTFLRNIRQSTLKRSVVVAPTGVAALNAGGVTIHSFFQLPFGPQLPGDFNPQNPRQHAAKLQRFTREKINIIRSIDLLIIDEISMVRADLLDAVDSVLRRFRKRNLSFGGVQLLMIGDLQQLAPITKDDEWELLRPYYDSPFFFSSRALQKTVFTAIELQHIYRQSDPRFIELLNKVRENQPEENTIKALNERYDPRFDQESHPGYINLTTHNNQAAQINERHLNKIKSRKHTFAAETQGVFPEYSFPTLAELELKVGAQVMFVKNDSSPLKRYYNGKIGVITSIDKDEDIVKVECNGDESVITVTPEEWKNCNYSLDEKSNEIVENVIGTFRQIPLKLAWAITIHKSQGLTFDKVIIDANAAFAHGQVYVALSRCTSLEGLVLSSRIEPHSIRSDSTVRDFTRSVEDNQPDENRLVNAKHSYELSLLLELFDFSELGSELSYYLKLAKDNAASIDLKLIEDIEKFIQEFNTHVTIVAEKFRSQVQQLYANCPDLESNNYLKERISKACGYFGSKLIEVVQPVWSKLIVETDNKTVKKAFHEARERLKENTLRKQACLSAGKEGITVHKYLTARAISNIEKSGYETADTEDRTPAHIPHPKLYRALKHWRSTKAEEADVPVYQVLSQKSLLQLVKFLPNSQRSLLAIKGIGKVKAEIFGEELLQIIMGYCSESGLEVQPLEPHERKLKTKEPKPDTKLLSFNLFKQGKSVQEIAAERHLTASTIESHLAHFIELGELEINGLVSDSNLKEISGFIDKNPGSSISEIKTALGDDISYGEIRLALAHFKISSD